MAMRDHDDLPLGATADTMTRFATERTRPIYGQDSGYLPVPKSTRNYTIDQQIEHFAKRVGKFDGSHDADVNEWAKRADRAAVDIGMDSRTAATAARERCLIGDAASAANFYLDNKNEYPLSEFFFAQRGHAAQIEQPMQNEVPAQPALSEHSAHSAHSAWSAHSAHSQDKISVCEADANGDCTDACIHGYRAREARPYRPARDFRPYRAPKEAVASIPPRMRQEARNYEPHVPEHQCLRHYIVHEFDRNKKTPGLAQQAYNDACKQGPKQSVRNFVMNLFQKYNDYMKDLYTVNYEREKQIHQQHWDNIIIDNIKANCCPGFKKFFRDKLIDNKNIMDTKVQLLQLAKIWEEEREEGTMFETQYMMSQKPAQLVM